MDINSQVEIRKMEEADPQIVKAFNSDVTKPGPDNLHVQFSLVSPWDNLWNRTILAMFADALFVAQDHENWVVKVDKTKAERIPPASLAYFNDLFLSEWKGLQSQWKRTVGILVEDSVTGRIRREEDAEIKARLFKTDEEQATRQRRKTRLNTVSSYEITRSSCSPLPLSAFEMRAESAKRGRESLGRPMTVTIGPRLCSASKRREQLGSARTSRTWMRRQEQRSSE